MLAAVPLPGTQGDSSLKDRLNGLVGAGTELGRSWYGAGPGCDYALDVMCIKLNFNYE